MCLGHGRQFSLDVTVVNRPMGVPRASEFFAMSSSSYLGTLQTQSFQIWKVPCIDMIDYITDQW